MIRGLAPGLDKTELDEEESREFLRFVEAADKRNRGAEVIDWSKVNWTTVIVTAGWLIVATFAYFTGHADIAATALAAAGFGAKTKPIYSP